MPVTPNLSLPYLEAGQAQKHVSLNESLRLLDAVTQLAVVAISASPPSEPEEGERHIVGASPSGAFAGHANKVAAFQDGAWVFLTPKPGWRAWSTATEELLVWDGAAWSAMSGASGGDVAGPEGATDHALARFDGTTGKLLQESAAAIDDSGALSAPRVVAGDTGTTPLVGLQNDNGTGVGPIADLERVSTSPAVNDSLGRVNFSGRNAAAEKVDYANISAQIETAADGAECGKLYFQTMIDGLLTTVLTLGKGLKPREVLNANRTYFVRTDGSDSNTGFADSAGGAFLTIQHAIDVARSLDLGICTVTISVGAGAFAEDLHISGLIGGSSPALIIKGAGRTSTTIGAGAGGTALLFDAVGSYEIGGFTIGSGNNRGISATIGGCFVNVSSAHGELGFGAIAQRCFDAQGGAKIFIASDVYIGGGGQRVYYQTIGGIIQHTTSTVFITANVTFSVAFCESDRHGIWIRSGTITFDLGGFTVTGKRYEVETHGLIDTAGSGANFFPGSIAGTEATDGVYN